MGDAKVLIIWQRHRLTWFNHLLEKNVDHRLLFAVNHRLAFEENLGLVCRIGRVVGEYVLSPNSEHSLLIFKFILHNVELSIEIWLSGTSAWASGREDIMLDKLFVLIELEPLNWASALAVELDLDEVILLVDSFASVLILF